MFEIIKPDTHFDFVGKFKICITLSLIAVIASIIGVFTKMQYGVDFRGGAEVQVKFATNVGHNDLRNSLSENGFSQAQVQSIGDESLNEYLIKIPGTEDKLNELTDSLEKTLGAKYTSAGLEIRKVDIVGPRAGAELRTSGFLAMMWALVAIMVYVGLRFDFKYAPGAIAALIHDSLIVLGVYAFCGVEFTLQTVAAVLAVIGYSINDTVIIYDRVREIEAQSSGISIKACINKAVNETLSRTILTTGTTLAVSLAMLFLGGGAIRDFFLAFSVGIVVGTYSTVYVAAPAVIYFERWMKNTVSKKKEVARV
jgi:preprotein translocase subunit SecF